MKGGLNFLIPSPSAEGHFFCPKIPPYGRAFWEFGKGTPPAPPFSLAAKKKSTASNTRSAAISS